jgi:PBP1b-binding outer membrane lipoprotein LpoB
MKKYLIALPFLSLVFAGCAKKDEPATLADKTKAAAETAVDKTKEVAKDVAERTKEVAVDVKNAVSDKLTEWKLTPFDIKADLEKGGRVVRTKTLAAGEKVGEVADNARIVTVINGKLVADSELSALKINVDADLGVVTLSGTVASADLLGKAVALALDTNGVSQVVSLLKVEVK